MFSIVQAKGLKQTKQKKPGQHDLTGSKPKKTGVFSSRRALFLLRIALGADLAFFLSIHAAWVGAFFAFFGSLVTAAAGLVVLFSGEGTASKSNDRQGEESIASFHMGDE